MVMDQANRNRILYFKKMLEEYSDEENPLSTVEIIKLLKDNYGISAHRTTIPKDIAALQEFGVDIVAILSTQNKYFIGSRQFELPEIKLLIDAVESSKFITTKKSKELISKLTTLTSQEQAKNLKRNLYIANRVKTSNEMIYYIVDAINKAINEKKQIEFQYYEFLPTKKKVLKHNGEKYQLSPYSLAWSGDYYYVIGYCKKHQKIVKFRVDRIVNIPTITNNDAIQKPDNFNVAEFSNRVFQMYDGEDVIVELQCDNSLMKNLIDRFGEDVKTVAYDKDSFKAIVEVSASSTFFGWVFGFDGKISIISPEYVKEKYKGMIMKSANLLI